HRRSLLSAQALQQVANLTVDLRVSHRMGSVPVLVRCRIRRPDRSACLLPITLRIGLAGIGRQKVP
ncbi:hypothetical protein ACV36R_30865, partial [Pseudomonas aeruginosa]